MSGHSPGPGHRPGYGGLVADVAFHNLPPAGAPHTVPGGIWIVRTAEEWERSVTRLDAGVQALRTAAEAVDWATGGFGVRIERLQQDQHGLRVFACEQRPGRSCVVTTALSNPCDVVVTRRSELPVELVYRVETYECE